MKSRAENKFGITQASTPIQRQRKVMLLNDFYPNVEENHVLQDIRNF